MGQRLSLLPSNLFSQKSRTSTSGTSTPHSHAFVAGSPARGSGFARVSTETSLDIHRVSWNAGCRAHCCVGGESSSACPWSMAASHPLVVVSICVAAAASLSVSRPRRLYLCRGRGVATTCLRRISTWRRFRRNCSAASLWRPFDSTTTLERPTWRLSSSRFDVDAIRFRVPAICGSLALASTSTRFDFEFRRFAAL